MHPPDQTDTRCESHINTRTQAYPGLRVYTAVNTDTKWKFARKHGGHESYLRPADIQKIKLPLPFTPIVTAVKFNSLTLINTPFDLPYISPKNE